VSTWHREVAEADLDYLIRCNAHPFSVAQWQKACRDYLDLVARSDEDRRRLLQTFGDARVVAVRARELVRAGRKTAKLADLIDGTKWAS
jgi:hypothetical protein